MDRQNYHKLLQRQIGKYLDSSKQYPPEVEAFISAVDASYKHYERDRELIERAMMLNSEELETLLADVRAKSELQKKILEQLKTLLDDPSDSTFHQNDNDLELLVKQLQKNVSERAEQKKIIEKALEEKEVLLKEIHHRVKNNLQVITSLLNLQAKRIPDPSTRDLFKNSQHRINSIAIIHEMLYGSEDIGRINFKEYIANMVQTLILSFRGARNEVVVELDIDDTHLEMDLAIPLGLIVNELVTNSLKYGLSDQGVLSIKLINDEPTFELHIRDDGPGMDIKSSGDAKTLGLKMVDYLIQQIEGKCEILPGSIGAHIKLTFSNHLND
jgi:two-component sensor histidine kinase